MSDPTLFAILIVLTFLTAGTVKGITGMGLPTVAMGILGAFVSPTMAAALLLIPSLVTNVWQMLVGKSLAILVRRFGLMSVCVVIGTVMGAQLLQDISPLWAGFGLGVALMVYAGYSLFAPNLSIPPLWESKLSPLIGMVTGFITGLTGVFVMPAVPYLSALKIDKEALVQALGLSFTVSTVALGLGLFPQQALNPSQLQASAWAVVPALLGMWLGQHIRQRISPKRFRVCFFMFLLMLGLQLLLKPWY